VLTIFAAPKPFSGHVGLIQANALRSWTALPGADVLVFGENPPTATARHVPGVARSPEGTPLFHDVLAQARALARHDLLCFVNADLILFGDLIAATRAARAELERFLLVGRRTNLDVTDALGVDDLALVRTHALREGAPSGPEWIDYFVFPRDLFGDVPPLVIGRAGIDNWLLWKARSEGAALVDASADVLVVHQNHDYAHHPGGKEGVWYGAEAQRNLRLLGGTERRYYVTDATHVVSRGRVRANRHPSRLIRAAWRSRGLRPALRMLHYTLAATYPLRRRLGIRRA
jgi:hypothetical protein